MSYNNELHRVIKHGTSLPLTSLSVSRIFKYIKETNEWVKTVCAMFIIFSEDKIPLDLSHCTVEEKRLKCCYTPLIY